MLIMLSVLAPCKHSARWQHLLRMQTSTFYFLNETNDNRNIQKESSGATKWQQKSQVVFPREFVSSH
jgi:hypothetical protein